MKLEKIAHYIPDILDIKKENFNSEFYHTANGMVSVGGDFSPALIGGEITIEVATETLRLVQYRCGEVGFEFVIRDGEGFWMFASNNAGDGWTCLNENLPTESCPFFGNWINAELV